MKQTKLRILSALLAVLMLLGLAACGKAEPSDPNRIKIGSYELFYKGAKIMTDYDGNDAIVVTLDYTNNSKEANSYLWSFVETVKQNGTELTGATIFLSEDSFDTVTDSQFSEVAAGETLEVQLAYVLADLTSEVELQWEELLGSKSGKLTIDPSTLTREEPEAAAQPEDPADVDTTDTTASQGDALLDWWNGEWYGWWTMYGCYGSYEGMDGMAWDVCGTIDIGEDYTGTVTLWDEDYTKAEPMASTDVSLSEAGTGEYGTVTSEGGYFTDIPLEHADWIVDPGLSEVEDLLWITGFYENGEDEFTYEIYLRPWGASWDDLSEDVQPLYYFDWYLPLIEAGAAMPDAIGEGTPAASAGTDTPASTGSGDIPGGDGIVSDEAVQKAWVYMSEVAKDIYNTTYEELAEYFGVDGLFDKQEFSDVYEANMRFYKWISSTNPHNFIYVNFLEKEPGVYKISAYNTSGFSGSEAVEKYLDEVKAEAAEADRAAAASAVMQDFSMEVKDPSTDNVITISTVLPESGWSSDKDLIVENEDPDAFGAGAIQFKLRQSVEKLESNKDSYKNLQEGEDRVIGGITFKSRTYEYIGYDWIEFVAQIDDTRALSIGLTDLDCFEGTMPDIILNNMSFQ